MPSYLKIKDALTTAISLFLILFFPPMIFLFWFTNTELNGSFQKLWELFVQQGFFATLYQICSPVFFGSATAWKILALFAAIQLLFLRVLPGKMVHGPITPKGNVPLYKANGVQSFVLTLALFCLGSFQWHWFSPSIIYDNFGAILGALNLFSLFFCLFLYLKGRFFPSSTDSGISGNFIFDYYWGTELYPKLLGWDLKRFTNCRFAMMGWPLILISFAAKQQQLYGLSDSMMVAVGLQLIYVAKFFAWETGYLRSLDIMHDRAGFYICWGCLVWVPAIYTSPTLYLVNHPNQLGFLLASTILALGALCIFVNYWADRQRQLVRATNGNCQIWGKKAATTIARYITTNGEAKENLLLTSGWWGVSRHFHYIPEVLGAFFWSVPALFDNFSPSFYVLFLTCLLMERAYRDDQRCAAKYGPDWEKYCEQVPYKIIPLVL
jgi:7-dehydrocholesterol reductase